VAGYFNCAGRLEGRAELEPVGQPLPMSDELASLRAVCVQLGLRLLGA